MAGRPSGAVSYSDDQADARKRAGCKGRRHYTCVGLRVLRTSLHELQPKRDRMNGDRGSKNGRDNIGKSRIVSPL